MTSSHPPCLSLSLLLAGSNRASGGTSRSNGNWNGKSPEADSTFITKSERTKQREREQRDKDDAESDARYGFDHHMSIDSRTAFLFNVRASTLTESGSGVGVTSNASHGSFSCLECFFVCEDGSTFKASIQHFPYFYILLAPSTTTSSSSAASAHSDYLEAESYLMRRYEGLLLSCQPVEVEDLSLLNHLSGLRRTYVKLSFRNVADLMTVRNSLLYIVQQNKKTIERKTAGALVGGGSVEREARELDSYQLKQRRKRDEVLDMLVDIREYDVPYITRVQIDLSIRAGCWYDCQLIPSFHPTATMSLQSPQSSTTYIAHSLTARVDLLNPPPLKKLTFDIETSKQKLKFPNAAFDQVMMISCMVDGAGVLIVNREFVGEDIVDFEYSPTDDMRGEFECINCANEQAVLAAFFDLIRRHKPLIFITYNGDFFDWPFIDKRAQVYGWSLLDRCNIASFDDTYYGKQALHLDCFAWVKRDSYLPQGSQGLKAVTKAKLKYDPVEMDMERMMTMAMEEPTALASYSVSDAVSTYYLYMKFVHFFIFSLSTIIPMSPADVLRKGSGTLCESLLQVEAKRGNIIAPNKQEEELDRWYGGRLVDSETYIGGHVECIESGVFRNDIPVRFKLNAERLRRLHSGIEKTMRFAVEKEYGRPVSECSNWEQVRAEVETKLSALIAQPSLDCLPLIYHLDVGAMYPNIILTNRLQPMAIVDDSVCAACVWNVEGEKCQRRMEWKWKGKYYPATRSEVENIRRSLEYESNVAASASTASTPATSASSSAASPKAAAGGKGVQGVTAAGYNELPASAQSVMLKSKVKSYSHKVYSKYTVESTESRTAIVCQRENSFYVDTVRAFRDRRFVYKVKGKEAKRALDEAVRTHDTTAREQWSDTVLVYDSLQLAHKCILNSFYGYVMRRGARWHSIEMAGIVTNTGAELIKEARELIDDIGRPLELDTDGIWCMLPSSFPDAFTLEWTGGGSAKWSYPCSLLNESVAERYSNSQYQTLDPLSTSTDASMTTPTTSDTATTLPVTSTSTTPRTYSQSTECSILFEVDGPYRAMVLPAAREEGKNIKKRYAVFDEDGRISELKGFEIKRRGELKLIKVFQGGLFERFLDGSTLEECYAAVGAVCNQWLDVLLSRGEGMEEEDVIDLISEQKSMSETVEDYGDRRSTSISTARRLAEFLGAEMLVDKGLNCKYVIAAKPDGAPTSERAIPTDIFQADEAVKRKYLRQWLRDSSMDDFDVRSLVDWPYYIGRLSAAIQKIVTIPAAMQKVANPVERVKHPDWLGRRVRERDEAHKQMRIGKFFNKAADDDAAETAAAAADVMDIEDVIGMGDGAKRAAGKGRYTVVKRKMGTGGQRVTIELGDDDDEVERALVGQVDKRMRSVEEDEGHNEEGDAVMAVDTAVTEERKEQEQDSEQPADEFSSWLSTQKLHWKALRERRKKAQRSAFLHPSTAALSSTSASAPGPSITDGLHSYLRHSSASLTSSAWQIISVLPDVVPGYFRFHVLLHPATLTMVSVKADRVWLLNRRQRMEQDEALKRVERSLPRGRKAHYLYEVRVDEREWQERESQYLDGLRAEQVEGIYETQVPLLSSIIRDVGCVCSVRPGARSLTSGGQPTFDVADLVYRTVGECGYLQSSSLYKGYLYESHSGGRGGLGVMCLFFEQSTEVLVVVINSFGGEEDAVNVNKLYRDCYKEMARAARQAAANSGGQSFDVEAEDDDDMLIPKHSFSVRRTTSTADAYTLVREQLHRYKQLSSHPTILLTQVSTPLSMLYSHLPSLRTDFPVIAIPAHSADCAYPPFNWLQFALRHCLTRYLSCADWYNGMLDLCRYAHVPIGCVGGEGGEVVSGMMDVVVARRLKEAKHVLWSSRGGGAEVEVGGRWVEEERALVGDDDDAGRTEVNNGGCYRSTCYELTLSRMCVNAILQSSEIEEESGRRRANGRAGHRRPDLHLTRTYRPLRHLHVHHSHLRHHQAVRHVPLPRLYPPPVAARRHIPAAFPSMAALVRLHAVRPAAGPTHPVADVAAVPLVDRPAVAAGLVDRGRLLPSHRDRHEEDDEAAGVGIHRLHTADAA